MAGVQLVTLKREFREGVKEEEPDQVDHARKSGLLKSLRYYERFLCRKGKQIMNTICVLVLFS